MTVEGGVKKWPMDMVMQLLRTYGPGIGRLAKQGDLLSRKLMAVYRYCYDHPNDLTANKELRDRLHDYMQREMMQSWRTEAAEKYGHLVDEKPIAMKIYVPDNVVKH